MNTSQHKRPPRRRSAILHTLHRFSSRLYALVLSSLLGRLMTRSDSFGRYERSDGFLHRLFRSKKKRSDRMLFRFCQSVAAYLEKSLFCRSMGAIGRGLLHCSINSYGIFFLFFGCLSILTHYIGGVDDAMAGISGSLLMGGACILLSLPLFATGRSLASGIRTSRILHWLVVDGFGIAEERLSSYGEAGRDHPLLAFILALLLGALTFFVMPHFLLGMLVILLFIFLILRDPEIGMVISVALLPFFSLTSYPTRALLLVVCTTLLGYALKLLCGKRSLRMESADWMVLLLLALFMMGGVATSGGTASLQSALTYVALGAMYFVVANLVRSQEGVKRMSTALLLGTAAMSFLGIVQYVFTKPLPAYLDLTLFADLGGRVSSLWGNPNMLAEHLALLLPTALAVLMIRKRLLRGVGSLLCLMLTLTCLVLTWTRGAWLGTLIALLAFLLLLSHKSLSWVMIGSLPVVALAPLLPDHVLRRFASIGSKTDSSILYRVHLWEGVEHMLGDHWLTGVGVGESAFCAVYAGYALPGIETAMHPHSLYLSLLCSLGVIGLVVFALALLLWLRRAFGFVRYTKLRAPRLMVLGGVCGILALLVMGLFDDVWYNYRIYMLFWTLVGLVSAQVRIGEAEAARAEQPLNDVRTQGEVIFHFY